MELTIPRKLVRFPWRECYRLCKPKVVALIVFTAIVGMLLSTDGMVPIDTFLFATIGIALGAASGAAINHFVDQRIDAIMERTKNRPLPQGQLTPRMALAFAISIGILSMLILYFFVNPLTALLTFISMVGYAIVYTMFLKRATPQNIVLGGAAGAAPPILGWAAVTGEVNYDALLLFLIIFVWTPPHFWALAIKRRKEYAKADIPMLPVTHGVIFTKYHILLYTLLLFAVTLMPFVTQMSGLIYLAGAIALGIGFIYHATKLCCTEGDQHSMKTFGYSIFYLSALFAFLLLDHYAREFIRAFILT
ncbi:MAG: heme o synthase [Sedimenticolaceae bacterium]|nr:heme o synthase [Sedimenticolaceae bacterium]